MDLKEFIDGLAEFLKSGMGSKVKISREYPDGYAKRPLDTAAICIGIDKISTTAGGYFASDEQGETYTRTMDITLRFDILRPDNAQECHDIFTELCELLLRSDCPVKVSGICCGEMSYNRMIGGFCLSARAEAAGMAAQMHPAGNIREFVVRGSGHGAD